MPTIREFLSAASLKRSETESIANLMTLRKSGTLFRSGHVGSIKLTERNKLRDAFYDISSQCCSVLQCIELKRICFGELYSSW